MKRISTKDSEDDVIQEIRENTLGIKKSNNISRDYEMIITGATSPLRKKDVIKTEPMSY